MLVNGLAGEVSELTEAERQSLVDACLEVGGLPVLVGLWAVTGADARRFAQGPSAREQPW